MNPVMQKLISNLVKKAIQNLESDINHIKHTMFSKSPCDTFNKVQKMNEYVTQIVNVELIRIFEMDKFIYIYSFLEKTYATNTEDKCSICLDQAIRGPLYHLPCGHEFHQICFKNYKKYQCPMCRQNFVAPLILKYSQIVKNLKDAMEVYV